MAQNHLNNGETVRLVNDGAILSHSSADIKSGDLVLHGADNSNVVLKGVAMNDIVLAANVKELKYNVGSVSRIGEWLFSAILGTDANQFTTLFYNMTDKIFVDSASADEIVIDAIFMLDPRVEPKELIDASAKVTLTTFVEDGTGEKMVNEVFEITITKSSDLGSAVKAIFSIVGNNTHDTPVTGLVFDAVNTDIFEALHFDLTLTHVTDVDLYEGQKFWIATRGDNSGSDVVAAAGMLTVTKPKGPYITVGISTVDKGLNQDEGPQGIVGRIPILVNY